jgi:hypothetical protein
MTPCARAPMRPLSEQHFVLVKAHCLDVFQREVRKG